MSLRLSEKKGSSMDKSRLYRAIPKVDVLLESQEINELIAAYGRAVVVEEVRSACDEVRQMIDRASEEDEAAIGTAVTTLPASIEKRVRDLFTPNVRKVINATGTILHTNIGRAPISRESAVKLADIVTGYSNLEYDLENGRRGERYAHFEKLICRLTGAEAAMVVNNNAAAVMLILSSLARGGEVVVSRGELVEIGGKFRIPDVMEQSGAVLREVGTTNKTHLSDYEDAVNDETKALLKVHTSNYRMIGFTESVPIEDLKPLATEKGIPVIEDLGSGVLVDMEAFGLRHEPTVQESIRAGADVVCFSGDKLLGGPQAGIIIGKKVYIEKMKKNQLTRALRVDKFTVTALELTLLEYLNREKTACRVPVLRMISESADSVKERAEAIKDTLEKGGSRASITVEPSEAEVGGGSLPEERLPSYSVVIRPETMSSAKLEKVMLTLPVPVLARVSEDAVRLDIRTCGSEDTALLVSELCEVLK